MRMIQMLGRRLGLSVVLCLGVMNAWADSFSINYTCPTYRRYTACLEGYYLTVDGEYNPTPTLDNTCTPCPDGKICPGGTEGPMGCDGDTYLVDGACVACLENYTISGEDHTSVSACQITCGGGTYIANANDTTCSNVGIGYWAAPSTVSQGDTGIRHACGNGLTTIGYGNGADEETDCGRVLNIGNHKVYLRSEKKTEKSLAVGINGVTYYGNMGTGVTGPLRIVSDGVTYTVYDDSMN